MLKVTQNRIPVTDEVRQTVRLNHSGMEDIRFPRVGLRW